MTLDFSHYIFSLVTVICCLLSSLAFGLPADNKQPAELFADSVNIDQQNHYGEYIGNIRFQQGTSHLEAAKATTKGDEKNKLIHAVAIGTSSNQAHFWTKTNENEPELHAYADKIQYFPEKNLIELIGNARVIQGKNIIQSDKIIYDTLKQRVFSKGNKHQTTIILHPKKKDKSITFH